MLIQGMLRALAFSIWALTGATSTLATTIAVTFCAISVLAQLPWLTGSPSPSQTFTDQPS